MALPKMDADPTELTRVRPPDQVTSAMCVLEALARLEARGETDAVVHRSGRPVGVVTAGALARALGSGRAGAPVTTVTDYVVVPVDPDADAHATIRTFTEAAWDWLRRRPT